MSARSDSARHLTVPVHHVDDLCVVAPAPDLNEKMKEQFERLRKRAPGLLSSQLIRGGPPQHVGLNDGLIYPGTYFPTGTTAAVAQRAALDRAPLRGTVRVVVVLVDFSDKVMAAGAEARFEELFFSSGQLTHGSVKEYFTDVSGGLISIDGEVVGPYRMPQTLATYVGADNGLQATQPNARTLANDAITAANADVNFAPYDNDGNGYVDAFIVVHAGRGAEESGSAGDIWSHKWVVPAERNVDGVKIFAYLTIPEDAKIGVSAHEIGHLIFGWPDLYDTDGTSEGIGNWCLMAGGSWGLGGDRPTHPSAWCKANQGWISIVSQTTNATVAVSDVKSSRRAYRLWKDGAGGNEYFLVENRQQDGYDASLPGEGLLIWHIDEAVGDNKNESHYKVALVQADGKRHLENNTNRGDAGDPYPGSASNAAFSSSTTPNSKSYAGADTCVSVTNIPATATTMSVNLGVRCLTKSPKETKDLKDVNKEIRKEIFKERPKEFKDFKDRKEGRKEFKDRKEFKEFKEFKEGGEFGGNKFTDGKAVEGAPPTQAPAGFAGQSAYDVYGGGTDDVSARLASLEAAVQALLAAFAAEGGQGQAPGEQDWDGATSAGPFIGTDERPQLGHQVGGADMSALREGMEAGAAEAKRAYDALPPQ